MLKKMFMLMSSMKFGLISMVTLCVLSLAGSLIPQGKPHEIYAQAYPQAHGIITSLGLNELFSSPVFIALLCLLCANLTLCTIVRIRRVINAHESLLKAAATAPPELPLDEQKSESLARYLKQNGFKARETGEATTYHKNSLGHYGSWLVHVSFLLIIVFGAFVLYFSETKDYTVFPGESLILEDGTELELFSFNIADESGRLDFKSELEVTSPDGVKSGRRSISVNYPLSYKGYKYYQQTYGTAGSLTAVNTSTGGSDDFILTEPALYSADGKNGIWFEALYPGYIRDEDGHFTLISSSSGVYADPVYQVHVISDSQITPVLAFTGETITIGELDFTFNPPVEYPGIRIKKSSPYLLTLLYAAFTLMTLGFWLCFFAMPAVVTVFDGGYTLITQRNKDLKLKLEIFLKQESDQY